MNGQAQPYQLPNFGKCRSRSRRPPGWPDDRRPRLFNGRTEAQMRRLAQAANISTKAYVKVTLGPLEWTLPRHRHTD